MNVIRDCVGGLSSLCWRRCGCNNGVLSLSRGILLGHVMACGRREAPTSHLNKRYRVSSELLNRSSIYLIDVELLVLATMMDLKHTTHVGIVSVVTAFLLGLSYKSKQMRHRILV